MSSTKVPISQWRKIAMATWRPRLDGWIFRVYLADPAAFDPVPWPPSPRGNGTRTRSARPQPVRT